MAGNWNSKGTSSLVLGIVLGVMVNSGHEDGKPRREWEWESLCENISAVFDWLIAVVVREKERKFLVIIGQKSSVVSAKVRDVHIKLFVVCAYLCSFNVKNCWLEALSLERFVLMKACAIRLERQHRQKLLYWPITWCNALLMQCLDISLPSATVVAER